MVVVGFDGSAAGERALDRAAKHVAGTQGHLIVVHAIDSEVSAGGLSQSVLEEPSAGRRRSILDRAITFGVIDAVVLLLRNDGEPRA